MKKRTTISRGESFGEIKEKKKKAKLVNTLEGSSEGSFAGGIRCREKGVNGKSEIRIKPIATEGKNKGEGTTRREDVGRGNIKAA